MLYKAFRIILIFLSLAITLLSIFALIGSYDNKSYLTGTYLIKFQLTGINLNQVIDVNQFSKRNLDQVKRDWSQPTTTTPAGDYATTSVAPGQWVAPTPTPSASASADAGAGAGSGTPATTPNNGQSVASPGLTPSGYYTSVPGAIHDLLSRLTPVQLGIAEVYSIGFWGYCRGEILTSQPKYSSTGQLIQSNNQQVNFTWCSKPQPGFFFNPVTILKQEMTRAINGEVVDSSSLPIAQLTTQSKSEIKVLIDNISLDYFNLPGALQKQVTRFEQLTKAAFALTVTVIVFAFIETIMLIMGYYFSPNKCCLSFLNFLFELVIAVLSLASAATVTGIYMNIRDVVNKNSGDFGIKAFLSINFYAFMWSSVVAGGLLVLFNFLGHFVGLFGSGRKRYKQVGAPEAAYEHKEEKKEEKGETDSDSE